MASDSEQAGYLTRKNARTHTHTYAASFSNTLAVSDVRSSEQARTMVKVHEGIGMLTARHVPLGLWYSPEYT